MIKEKQQLEKKYPGFINNKLENENFNPEIITLNLEEKKLEVEDKKENSMEIMEIENEIENKQEKLENKNNEVTGPEKLDFNENVINDDENKKMDFEGKIISYENMDVIPQEIVSLTKNMNIIDEEKKNFEKQIKIPTIKTFQIEKIEETQIEEDTNKSCDLPLGHAFIICINNFIDRQYQLTSKAFLQVIFEKYNYLNLLQFFKRF